MNNDTSNISSNAIGVCFCEESSPQVYRHNCSIKNVSRTVYSGGTISVSVVMVGQREGTVPGTVMAQLTMTSDVQTPVESMQYSQFIHSANCTMIHYTNISANGTSKITLTALNSDARDEKYEGDIVYIDLQSLECPPGFTQQNGECQCLLELSDLRYINCDIVTTSIERSSFSNWWIGFVGNDTIYSKECPFDFCEDSKVRINTTMPNAQDVQCAYNRRGTLCGACKPNFSNALGSTRCIDCSSSTFMRILGKILLFGVLGIVLVLFITILDIGVTSGTLNAIVFYVNVLKVNTNYFYDVNNTFVTRGLRAFIAWMNLDIGIEMCFYNKMKAVGKTGLQFIFPLYLWFLAGLIIYCGRKHQTVVKMIGKNTTKVLATIILLSYAQLIQTIINIWRTSRIYSHRQMDLVWSVNGEIPFFHKNHFTLFVVAVAMAAVTLPYTLVLLFIQCLRKKSDVRVLRWVNKLKPFFDAYTGPYKDKYHFWTGFLLIVRIFLFTGIATNSSKGPMLNLSLITVTLSILLLVAQTGVYKNCVLNIIEGFTYVNLIALTTFTTFNKYFSYGNDVPVILCIGSMFLLFCGVVVYHVLKKLSDTERGRLMKLWLLDMRCPWMRRKPIRSLILPYIDPDSVGDLSSSDDDGELDPILRNAPPVARYDEYREPLIETEDNDQVF